MHGEDIEYAYGFWGAVVFNVVLFLVFALTFLVPKGKVEWRTFGVFTAFLIALFTEMFGIPLTIYILISIMGKGYPAQNPFSHPAGHLLLTFLGIERSRIAFMLIHLITNTMIFGGFYVMSIGWKKIYAGVKEKKLVTDGIYSYVRHPQYVGLFLITLGLLIQWPTIITLAMEPLLLVAYYRLAMREEKEMEKAFGDEWRRYKERTPAFIPRLKGGKMKKGPFLVIFMLSMPVGLANAAEIQRCYSSIAEMKMRLPEMETLDKEKVKHVHVEAKEEKEHKHDEGMHGMMGHHIGGWGIAIGIIMVAMMAAMLL